MTIIEQRRAKGSALFAARHFLDALEKLSETVPPFGEKARILREMKETTRYEIRVLEEEL